MTLRARLTLIYGLLLAVVLVAVGLSAELVIQAHFADETQSTLLRAAGDVYNRYTLEVHRDVVLPGLPPSEPFNAPYLEIVSAYGLPVQRSANLGASNLPIDAHALKLALHRHSTFQTARLAGEDLAVYYTPMVTLAQTRLFEVLVVAESQGDIRRVMDLFHVALYGGEAFLWIVFIGITWLVVGSVLRPIRGMTDQAAAIAATKDFSARVPVGARSAEIEQLAVTFNRMLASLAEAYSNQQRFLADASHELRTPLTVIRGNLHFLEEVPEASDADRAEALHEARAAADRVGRLVGDLLILSGADAGSTPAMDPVELDRVVVEAYRQISSRRRVDTQYGPGVHVGLDTLDEVVVLGDHDRLVQLVVILLDNAVKYTPPGGRVELELVADRDVKIRVADTGTGIAPEDRALVFRRFYRSPSTRSMGDGSGLGLAIAQWIAESHGGGIDFEPREGGGTVFTVTLPVYSRQTRGRLRGTRDVDQPAKTAAAGARR